MLLIVLTIVSFGINPIDACGFPFAGINSKVGNPEIPRCCARIFSLSIST
jgi:hypothetical protein